MKDFPESWGQKCGCTLYTAKFGGLGKQVSIAEIGLLAKRHRGVFFPESLVWDGCHSCEMYK